MIDIVSELQKFCGEYNNAALRRSVTDQLQSFLDGFVVDRSIYDYQVVCDDRNNSAVTIAHNELVVDIWLYALIGQPIVVRYQTVTSGTSLTADEAQGIDYLSIIHELASLTP